MSGAGAPGASDERVKVLVREKIGDSGVSLLRDHFDVELGIDWSEQELGERIGAYHGILIRSATQMTAELIGRASNLRVIGRAGVGWTTSTWRRQRNAASSSPTHRSRMS